MPEVSVVIATYNRGALVERALDSVFCQTFGDYEVVVADDGSTDGTAERLAKLGSRVRVLRLEHQGRPSLARNRAVEKASGRYLAFLDSDDAWEPRKLERQVSLMRADPEVVLCYTDARFVDESRRFLYLQSRRERPAHGWVLGELLERNFVALSSAVAAAEAVRSVGGFEESLRMAEDWCLWLRLSMKGRVAFLNETLCTNTVGHQELTRDKAALFEDAMRALELVRGELPTEPRGLQTALAKGRARLASMLARNYLFTGRAGEARRLYAKALADDPLRVEALPFYVLSLLGRRPAAALRALKRGAGR
ncbi:MAG: glycosyltransferase family 2 protein [Candidatus Eisenbacteria bacterium]|nr:glycosyltransferase family 2 protein [Candidatus Eisenbacteria bacterium]